MALQGLPVRDDQSSTSGFTSVLGGGMSSRLFQEVREFEGYAQRDPGLPYALCRHGTPHAGQTIDVSELMRVVMTTLARNAQRGRRKWRQGGANESRVIDGTGKLRGARQSIWPRQMLAYGRPVPLEEMGNESGCRHGRKARGRPHWAEPNPRLRRLDLAAVLPAPLRSLKVLFGARRDRGRDLVHGVFPDAQ